MLSTTAPHVNHGQENTGRLESVWREGPASSPKRSFGFKVQSSRILCVLGVTCVFGCVVGLCGRTRTYTVVIRSESQKTIGLGLSFEQGQRQLQSEQIVLEANSRDTKVYFDSYGSLDNVLLRIEGVGPRASDQAPFKKKGLSGKSLHLVLRRDGTFAEEPALP